MNKKCSQYQNEEYLQISTLLKFTKRAFKRQRNMAKK